MDIDPGRVPHIPDPATVPPGSKLLVRLRDEDRANGGRLELAMVWTQKGETYWMVDLDRLDSGIVMDAMLLTPDAPFGSTPWTEMDKDERARLYWGATQALCARPSFERTVADSWVRAAMKFDGVQESNQGSLVNRLRRDAMVDARATISARLAGNVDVDAIVKSIDPTKLMLEWLRSTDHFSGGAHKLKAAVRARIDERVNEAVRAELDTKLGDTFEYLRKSMGMAVNNAIGRLGAAGKASNG